MEEKIGWRGRVKERKLERDRGIEEIEINYENQIQRGKETRRQRGMREKPKGDKELEERWGGMKGDRGKQSDREGGGTALSLRPPHLPPYWQPLCTLPHPRCGDPE